MKKFLTQFKNIKNSLILSLLAMILFNLTPTSAQTSTQNVNRNHLCNKKKCSGKVANGEIVAGGSYTPSGVTAGNNCSTSGCDKNQDHRIRYDDVSEFVKKAGTYTVNATCDNNCSIVGGTLVVFSPIDCPYEFSIEGPKDVFYHGNFTWSIKERFKFIQLESLNFEWRCTAPSSVKIPNNKKSFTISRYESIWDSLLTCTISGTATFQGTRITIDKVLSISLKKIPTQAFSLNNLYINWSMPFSNNGDEVIVSKGQYRYVANYGFDISYAENSGINANINAIVTLDSMKTQNHSGQLSSNNKNISVSGEIYNHRMIINETNHSAVIIVRETSANNYSKSKEINGTTKIK